MNEPLDPKVWFQVSRKYRTVARLPEGMNGNEALVWGIKEHGISTRQDIKWAQSLSERDAGDYFLRCHTSYEYAKHLLRTLSEAEFNAFKNAGGRTYR